MAREATNYGNGFFLRSDQTNMRRDTPINYMTLIPSQSNAYYLNWRAKTEINAQSLACSFKVVSL